MEKCYESTRDAGNRRPAKQAILEGISKDGGLYVLRDLDQIQLDLDSMMHQSYMENAVDILEKMLPDYTRQQLEECAAKAYQGTFEAEEITPLKKVGDQYVLQLYHGPTSAFKDVALTMLPQLMAQALKETGQKALILTATSGDTGKAALSGFADAENIRIAVFYPHEKVSQIQYRQMASQPGNNTEVYAVKGNFDDAQSKVKELFLNEELNQLADQNHILMTSANSINVGRLVPQIVYYFEAYKQLVHQGVIQTGDPVVFSVPTGNFGDVLAGYYAYKMGLPVSRFIVASNANNVLSEFLETGVYDRSRPFIQTISPSMDILISSNLERLLYYMSDQNNEQVAAWMKDLKETGRYDIGAENLKKLQDLFAWGYMDDEKTKEVIGQVYRQTGEVLDPHSAIGYGVAQKFQFDAPVICLATASPYKFSQDVLAALGYDVPDEFEAMKQLASLSPEPVPAPLARLETAPILHQTVLEIDEMADAVKGSLEKLS